MVTANASVIEILLYTDYEKVMTLEDLISSIPVSSQEEHKRTIGRGTF